MAAPKITGYSIDPETTLTPARPEHGADILALARRFHQEDGHPLGTAGEAALTQLIHDDAHGLAFEIVRTGSLIGYAVICFGYSVEWGGRDAFVDDLYLVDDARGLGIGRRVIERLIDAARAAGCGALHLEIMPGNRAERLYRRLGFADRGSQLMTRPLA